jgi:GNAT superfamily N-acetyltransferase
VISVRRARPADAAAIGAIHVAVWRTTYPGLLPSAYLARLSAARQAAHYEQAIRGDVGVYVATAAAEDAGRAAAVVGFVTAAPTRSRWSGNRLAEGEIETLYVLDDWHDRGLGRRLVGAAAGHLAAAGCRSVFLWVLRDNPSRWFYERLGGRPVAQATIRVGGAPVVQMAYLWDPIDKLVQAASPAP